jgi:hypothetical protein
MHRSFHFHVLRVLAGASLAAASFAGMAQGMTSAQADRAKQAGQIEAREREAFGRKQVHEREARKAQKAENQGDLGAGPIGARTQTVRERETAGDRATTNVDGTAGTR